MKTHADKQLSRTSADRQLRFHIKTWGGKRTGAGRPNRSGAVNHMRRQKFTKDNPAHVTFRLLKGFNGMRIKSVHELLKDSLGHLSPFGVHAIHYSLQGNHIHLILEAESANALSRSMKSFGCRFAKGVKRMRGFKGTKVFNGRYHLNVVNSPRQSFNTLRYVLLNQAKHTDLIEHIDEFSSGFYFDGWQKLLGPKFKGLIAQKVRISKRNSSWKGRDPQKSSEKFSCPAYLSPPRTWLLAEGWKKIPA